MIRTTLRDKCRFLSSLTLNFDTKVISAVRSYYWQNNTLDNQCAKYELSTTKHVRDIALQTIQPATNYFENYGSNVMLAFVLQNMNSSVENMPL